MEELKLTGFVKAVNKNGILLETRDDAEGKWYNSIESCDKYITPDLKGEEVEITIMNLELRKFSFIKRITQTPKKLVGGKNTICDDEVNRRYRAMSISYAKDLVVADKIEECDMITIADGVYFYIMTGERKA